MEQLERILKCMMPNPTQHTDQPKQEQATDCWCPGTMKSLGTQLGGHTMDQC